MIRLFIFMSLTFMFALNPIYAAQVHFSKVLSKETREVSPHTYTFTVDLPAIAIEHQARLSLEARIDSKVVGGSNPWIQVYVNGTRLNVTHLHNKPNTFKMQRPGDITWFARNTWRVVYAPDFELVYTDKKNVYAIDKKFEPYRYEWDITKLAKAGANEITIKQLQMITPPKTMVMRNVVVEIGGFTPSKAIEKITPAPTGPVKSFIAGAPKSVPFSVKCTSGGRIIIDANETVQAVNTLLSLPEGKWLDSSADTSAAAPVVKGKDFKTVFQAGPIKVERTLKVLDDHVAVFDRYENTGDALAGIITKHFFPLTDKCVSLRLGGMPISKDMSIDSESQSNPSAFIKFAKGGMAIVAEDDILRVNLNTFNKDSKTGISNDKIGLEPGKSVTLEWSIYPVKNDYWDFVNLVRKNWDVNFKIPGPFTFARMELGGIAAKRDQSKNLIVRKPRAWYKNWIEKRDLKIICGGIPRFKDGRYAQGTGILSLPEFIEENRRWVSIVNEECPDVLTTAYFHFQICNEPKREIKYADCKLIDSKGKHAVYMGDDKEMYIFLPNLTNSYGKAIFTFLDVLIKQIGVRAIYWDEMERCVQHIAYDAPWDGITVLIDPKTHAVTKKVTTVPLFTQALRLKIIDYIRGKGLWLMGNSSPYTRTMLNQKIVRFVETWSLTSIYKSHLACPLGLGNKYHENSMVARAKNVRGMLMHGGTYYGHLFNDEPPEWVFTSVMYPITPVELYKGAVVGSERIHTAVSGIFGWPDGAEADVYVIDAKGNRVISPQVKQVMQNGKNAYEIRMPSDNFAILVRK